MGYIFGVDDTDIIYDFRSGQIPDTNIIDDLLLDLKDNKNNVICFLNKRQDIKDHGTALENGYTPYSMGECYGRQLTLNNELLIQKINNSDYWTVYRIKHYKGDSRPVTERFILETKDFSEAIERAERYIDNFLKYINEIR